jgi:hypothetical protein
MQRKTMKKVLQELTGSGSANDKLLIALSAVTKMFVGELVATGGLAVLTVRTKRTWLVDGGAEGGTGVHVQ